jgi:hypothetical protein
MIENWNDKMYFGKFKGQTVKEVFEHDATYLWWAINNTNKTNFKKEVKDAIQKQTEEIDAKKFVLGRLPHYED